MKAFRSYDYGNYYEVMKEIKTNADAKRNYVDYKFTLQRTLLKKPPQNDIQYQSQKSIEDALKAQRMNRDMQIPDSKQIYDDYLQLIKDRFSPEQYTIFIRYLSVYMGGSIPHTLFIRLFYQLVEKPQLDDQIMLDLPNFLASISFNNFTNVRTNFSKPEDEICAEIVITSTANATSPESYHSIYKAFKLLSEGYISPAIAKQLLSHYCKPESLNKLDLVQNFAIFNPDRIPHEYVLCSEFTNPLNEKDAIDKFETTEVANRIPTPYESVPFETIENQILSTRKLIEMFVNKQQPPLERLIPFFGIKSNEIIEQFPKFNHLAVKRLVNVYEKFYSNYKDFSHFKLNRLANNYLEFRICYKRVLKMLFDPVHFKIPGSKTVHLGTTEQIEKANNLLNQFIEVIFPGIENLAANFNLLKNHLFSGKVFTASHAIVAYCLSLSELIRVSNGFETDKLVEALKTEDGLQNLYKNTEMQCVDLIMIKAIRAINKINEITEFGFNVLLSKELFITCVHFENEDFTIETQVSPIMFTPSSN